MSTRLDSADPAVDELKRRARRRLVGAIVLALAAAVILPLLLESEPKPFGDDVSIQIPPVDSGKFVNSLSPSKGVADKAKVDSTASPIVGSTAIPTPGESTSLAAPAAQSPVEAEQRDLGQSPPATSPVGTAGAPRTAASDAKGAEAKPAATPEPKATDNTDAKALLKSEPEPAKTGADGFVVQLAAFADAGAARELAGKLKQAGFPGYTEALATNQGTVQRVRVGPFASREEADTALTNLKAAGYSNAIIAPAR